MKDKPVRISSTFNSVKILCALALLLGGCEDDDPAPSANAGGPLADAGEVAQGGMPAEGGEETRGGVSAQAGLSISRVQHTSLPKQ